MVNKAAAKSTNPQRSAARPAPAPVPNLPGKKRAQERTPYPNRNRNPLPAPGERHPVLGVNLGNGMYMPGQRPTHYYYQASYQEHAENVIREKVVHKVCIPGGTYVDYGSPEHKKAVIMTSTALGTSLVLGYLGSTGILAKAGETASSKLMPVVDKAGAKLGSLIGESSELTLAGGGSIKVPVSGNIKNMLLQMKVQNEVQKVVKETCEEIKEKKITELPDFKKENRVPLDRETILNSKGYMKTGKKVKGAQVYKKGEEYYYRDTFHTGEAAHLEVFDKRGHHLGEADPLTGIIRPGTIDSTKVINIK